MKLSELFNPNEFAARHLSFGDEAALLEALGEKSMDDFVGNTVPQSIRMPSELDLPEALTEADALAKLKGIASKNVINKSYIGLGYYPTRVPNVILRNVLENPGWYTAYTPYQAEIAQGRLEALLNFQQVCIDLTGFPVAGASLLDEATAAAEAMAMAHRVGKVKSGRFFVDARVYPQTLDVMKTRSKYFGFELVVGDFAKADEGEYFGALFQYVGKDGDVQDLQSVIGRLKAKGTIVAVAADIMSLVLLKPPAELGADIALGNTQRFGVPMGFGGPHAAYFAFKDEFKRSAPGRIIGVSKDASGKPALRMALSTREQHIRREKATSNICTAQALLANLAGMYVVYHGPEGVKRIANRIHALASAFADALVSDGLNVVHKVFFDTVTVDFGNKEKADQVFAAALESGYNLRRVNDTQVAAAFHETSACEDLVDLYRAFTGKDAFAFADDVKGRLNAELLRQDDILQHPVFNRYHTEHEMLRYLKKLEDRDLAMNRSMISLGSCTMKLNATAEMLPITWAEFSDIHPYAPEAQTVGYRELLADMENSLKAITGFDAISFQPNSGAQGEYSGMLAIRRYQEAQGEAQRNICLIPKSAHGTNPATAAMLGLKVVVVDTDEHGNVNIDDLKAKAEQHRDALSAIMITYPSTHGVYEEGIRDICRIIHENGGQVYMDGANLNAQIGIMQPAEVGAHEPAQNLLYPSRRRRSGHGSDWLESPSGSVRTGTRFDRHPQRQCRPNRRCCCGLRFCVHTADYLDVSDHDGQTRHGTGDTLGIAQRQLRCQTAGRRLSDPVYRQKRPRRARMYRRFASAQSRKRHYRNRHRQTPDGLRLPRPDGFLPRCRYADDRADRERKQSRTRPLHRRPETNQTGSAESRARRMAERRQPTGQRAAHRRRYNRQLGASVFPRRSRLPVAVRPRTQVLALRQPRGRRVRRPQSRVQLPTDGKL